MKTACVSTWHGNGCKYFPAFLETAKRNGIEPINADPSAWGGRDWTEIPWHKKTDAYLKFVTECGGDYTHFLFCDSYDVAFAAGMDEIMRKYFSYGTPIVIASECYPWPNPELAHHYPETPHRCKYLNAGFWIASGMGASQFLQECVRRRKPGQDDQSLMVDIYLSTVRAKSNWITLDNACKLAFCCNMDSLNFLEKSNGRPMAIDTGEKPCLFHGNGASDLGRVLAML